VTDMKKIALTGAGIATLALAFAPVAGADPTAGHSTKVKTTSPPTLCEIGSDDSTGIPGDPGMGPNVVCQGSFPQAPAIPCPQWPGELCPPQPMHWDQAVVTASGQFSWRDANIAVGYPGFHPETLVDGQTYHMQGWTIVPSSEGTRFTNDGTGHGMFISVEDVYSF
jgi:hypothetical protein